VETGKIKEFTGISSPYEEPERPELMVETDLHSPEDIVDTIVDLLKEKRIIKDLNLNNEGLN
jgi:adenylylsulfate kinase